MRVRRTLLAFAAAAASALRLAAQTATPAPVLSSIQSPYPAVQSAIRIAGGSYPAGAVSYGPAGAPLVISGKDFGGSGTVQFVAYHKDAGTGAEVAGTPVPAKITSWSESIVFVAVPSGAESGLVTVTSNEGKTSNGLPFIVTPGVYAGTCPAFPAKTQFEITTSSLPNGVANQSYNVTLGAQGGTPPYTWSLASGTLPSGLSLNSASGVISGTPAAAAGPLNLDVEARDSRSFASEAVLGLVVDGPSLTPATVYSYTVPAGGYAANGNLLGYTDQVMGQWSFTYDHLNRLSSGVPATGPYSSPKQYLCMNYDSFGNRTQGNLQTTACNPGNDPATAAYNAANHVTWTTVNAAVNGLGYDAAGNVIYDGSNYYAYDGAGRLCAVQTAPYSGGTLAWGYVYDAEGNRVAKGSITPSPLGQQPSCNMATNGFALTESYLPGQDGEQLTALDQNGNWERTNVYGDGKLLATYDPAGLHFHLSDPLGTRRVQANSAGEAEIDCQSLPFGDQQYCFADPSAPDDDQDEDASPLHFTAKQRDTESGNDFFGARYYQSGLGRWLSPDYSEQPEAVSYADLSNPQSLNLYSYVLNNPLTGTDEDGHGCGWYSGTHDMASGDSESWFEFDFSDCPSPTTLISDISDAASRASQTIQNAAHQAMNYLQAPRDQGCMLKSAAKGAGYGAGTGAVLGGLGGAGVGLATTAGGASIPLGLGGAAEGASVGGQLGLSVGTGIGFFSCATGSGGGGGGGSKKKWDITNPTDKKPYGNKMYLKDGNTGYWWSKDTAGHGGSVWKVYEEGPKGTLTWIADADEQGNYIVGKWKSDVGMVIKF